MGDSDDMQLFEALEGMSAAQEELSAMGYRKSSLKDLYDETVETTRDMVSEDWPQIEAVASALESTGHLDGPEVVKIIKGVYRG